VPLDLEGARKMIRVIDALEDSDDVQNVYANGDIPTTSFAESRRGVTLGALIRVWLEAAGSLGPPNSVSVAVTRRVCQWCASSVSTPA
jgi:hypothetical protein